MINNEDNKNTISFIHCEGTKDNWPTWEETCLARGRCKWCNSIFKGILTLPDVIATIYTLHDTRNADIKAQKSNGDAYE